MERIAIDEADPAPEAANLSMQEAVSLPLVAPTAWQVLVDRARLAPGQKVLIHAGSGGVRTVAIQLAKHHDATVATTAGAAGPGGNRYGDALGHGCSAISGPIERVAAIETATSCLPRSMPRPPTVAPPDSGRSLSQTRDLR